ncbi:MAG: aminoacyl-tRNA hydrolase [Candidatus Spechtbacteria bacterium]|nr:aminoacyl-tRNA hydrolase [Candidatus Spechtbacteria bacterium]
MKNTLLIVGLGNPGEKYAHTPHNAGFLVASKLLRAYNLEAREEKKLHSEIAETKAENKKIILAKPQTFMNKSGGAVKSLITNYSPRSREGGAGQLPITSSLWVIHDDIDLPLGRIKIVKNRGSAGHKGVEDIIAKLRTKNFVRFRIGIRPKRVPLNRPKTLMNRFVVAPFKGSDAKLFEQSLARCAEAIQLALKEGIEKAASVTN